MGREIGMETDATDEVLARIRKRTQHTESAWRPLREEILNKEEGIGHGRLARAFRPTYLPVAEPTRILADGVLGKLTVTLHSGRVSVQIYRDADAVAAGGFPRPR